MEDEAPPGSLEASRGSTIRQQLNPGGFYSGGTCSSEQPITNKHEANAALGSRCSACMLEIHAVPLC